MVAIGSRRQLQTSVASRLVTRGEEVFAVASQGSTYIPVETKHRLENAGGSPLVIIEVQCGDYLGEDDIVRFEDRYGRKR